ncbi:uncharacterized domain / RidA/YER057c/UK114 superfamily, group 5 [hydrothermal vent metagenome]|uniref:Uncharacterized domain / RidA/YER057c/UK114 superfamily, group 5 n=1 Tax=hydrothermal vent metagenome TaxID=652676 RepID=A0A3B1AIU7_9ZZZZ
MSVAHINPSNRLVAPSNAPFSISYAQPDQIQSLDKEKVITTIHFSPPDKQTAKDPQALNIVLPPLSSSHYSEVWVARDKLVSGQQGDIEFRKNNEILFGKICLDESKFDSLEDCSNHAYSSMLNFINQKEFPHLVRIWNFFPEINNAVGSIERYQSFCIGRYSAYQNVTEFERTLPAATAIGSHGKGLIVYFIATTKAGVQVENPRQISAYHYPEKYSPKSPSFARATLKHWPAVTHFFISGTASIVGHETLHEENVLIQLEETLKNIEALVTTVRDTHQQPIHDITNLSLMKVYIRYPEHYEMIQQALSLRMGKDASIIYLQGDICRENLLLEIEAFAEFQH